MDAVLTRRRNSDRGTEGRPREDPEIRPSTRKERGLRRNQPCQHLDLRHLSSRRGDSTFLLFKPLHLWYFVMAALAN